MAKRPAPITVETEIVTADDAAAVIAKRKAIKGHKTWMCWKRKAGSYVARLYTAAGIKAAMLDGGTKGRFWWYGASDGVGSICLSWSFAVHLLKCARGAERHGFSAA